MRTWMELGEDHAEYERPAFVPLDAGGLASICVGSDRESPSLRFKGDLDHKNEDAFLAAVDGPRVLLAVADAHRGREASHVLLPALERQLREVEGRVPLEEADLDALLAPLAAARGPLCGHPEARSRCSLTVAVHDASTGQGFGLSWGDSSCAVVSAGAAGRHAVFGERTKATFVALARPETLGLQHASRFAFEAGPGDVVLAYTDGIDECHYGHPRTSVTAPVFEMLWDAAEGDVPAFVRALTEVALTGVGGNPGGQDNIAVVGFPAHRG